MIKYIIILTLLLTGCTNDNKNPIVIRLPENTPLSENELRDSTISNIVGKQINIDDKEKKDFSAFENIEVDHDLSKLSGTMSQAIFSEFMYESDKYLGQTIKASGVYYEASNPNKEELFQGLLIVDTTQCCAGYLDIKFKDNQNKPNVDELIMLIGTLRQDENNVPYIEISDIIF